MSVRTFQHVEDRFYDPVAMTLRASLYLLGLCVVVDGIFPQLSIALLGGRDPFIQPIVKVTLLLVACLIYLIRHDSALRPIGGPAVLLIGYLLIDTLFIGLQRNFSDAIVGLYTGFFTLLAIMVLQACEMGLSEETVTRLLLIAFCTNLILEIAQFRLNAPLLAEQSIDGNFLINSNEFYGHVRAFGLFGSVDEASTLGPFIAGLAIAKLRRGWHPFLTLAVFSSCILMVYVVQVRLGFIELAICTASALVLRFYAKSGVATCLPYLNLAFTGGFLFWLAATVTQNAGITDSGSLFDRMAAWRITLQSIQAMPFTNALFGNGFTQHLRAGGGGSTFVLDSMYLQVMLQVGLCGLGALLVYYVWIWKYLLRWARESQSALVLSVAAAWSSVLSVGIINLMYPNLSTYVIDLFLCAGSPGLIAHDGNAE